MEAKNGDPKIHMAIHSTNHNGGSPQHPPANPYDVQADFTQGKGNFFQKQCFQKSEYGLFCQLP